MGQRVIVSVLARYACDFCYEITRMQTAVFVGVVIDIIKRNDIAVNKVGNGGFNGLRASVINQLVLSPQQFYDKFGNTEIYSVAAVGGTVILMQQIQLIIGIFFLNLP